MTSAITHKERTRLALARQPVERLPVQTNFTGTMGDKLAAYFQCAPEQLSARLDNHLLRVDVSYPARLSADRRVRFDWWGSGWGTETEGYWHAVAPLHETTKLDAYRWPNPDAPGLLADAKRAISADAGQHFVVPNFGFALFERAWSLRGFDQLLMDLLDRPGWVEELLERITDIQVRLAKRFVALGRTAGEWRKSNAESRRPKREVKSPGKALGEARSEAAAGVDGGYFGDDYGAQRGLLFSPKLWRQMFKPRLARMFAVFGEAGLPVILHSDGDIWPILPDLVDIGVTCLNPVQPEVLDHRRLEREFGRHLSFYGGISTQEILPQRSPVEVRAATRECIHQLAPAGTGLLLGPSHRLQSDIPLDNVAAMLAAFPGHAS